MMAIIMMKTEMKTEISISGTSGTGGTTNRQKTEIFKCFSTEYKKINDPER